MNIKEEFEKILGDMENSKEIKIDNFLELLTKEKSKDFTDKLKPIFFTYSLICKDKETESLLNKRGVSWKNDIELFEQLQEKGFLKYNCFYGGGISINGVKEGLAIGLLIKELKFKMGNIIPFKEEKQSGGVNFQILK